MTQTTSKRNELQAFRDRNALIRAVRTMLRGSGLDIRELADRLVISYPGHPEHGRIYVTYAHGEVSHRRTIWDYLGRLDGIASTSPDAEPCVDIQTIINAFTCETDRPS
ncbi:MAG TPA: hypothetical protein VGM53_09925 [Streptosporangiaceae bacterium]|jgi:hypothetical protein